MSSVSSIYKLHLQPFPDKPWPGSCSGNIFRAVQMFSSRDTPSQGGGHRYQQEDSQEELEEFHFLNLRLLSRRWVCVGLRDTESPARGELIYSECGDTILSCIFYFITELGQHLSSALYCLLSTTIRNLQVRPSSHFWTPDSYITRTYRVM